jgi:CRISPR-associated endonuclease Csn1
MNKQEKIIKRLGLDLGTKTIGWCLLNFQKEANKYDLIDMGVRSWQSNSTKADRQSYKSQRRQRKHLKSRLRRLTELLDQVGLPKSDPKERGKKCLFAIRAKAAETVVEPFELREILFHIAKNRGFRESEKNQEKTPEKGGLKNRVSYTENEINKESCSYSQWLVKQKKLHDHEKKKFKFRADSPDEKSPEHNNLHFPSRKLIRDEFLKIRSVQEPYFNKILWDDLEEIIFFERSYENKSIGKCSLFPDEYRLKKDDADALEFIILEKLSHITLQSKNSGEIRCLNREEIKKAVELLKSKKEIENTTLIENLKLSCEYDFKSKNSKDDKSIPGFKSELEGYLHFSKKALIEILSRFWSSEKRIGKIIYEIEQELKKPLERLDYLKYYGELMQSTPNFYIIPACSCAKSSCYNHQVSDEEKKWGKSPNSDLHVAFNQLKKLINAIIEKYGKIDEIVVELIRSDWVSAEEGYKIQKQREDNEKKNKEIKAYLEKLSVENNRNNKFKAKLYFEFKDKNLKPNCPYCGQTLEEGSLFTPDIQIEHVIPYRYTKSNALSQLILAHRSCNQKKGDKTPYEAFGHLQNYEELISNVHESKKWLFEPNALDRYLKITDGWLPNSLINTSLIAKHARSYLQFITDKVYATRGSITADLRHHFKLKKNRAEDDSHHAIDAFCIALISPGILQKLNHFDLENESFNNFLCANQDELIDKVKNTNILVSTRINHAIQGEINQAGAWGIYPNEPEEKYKKKGKKPKKHDASGMLEIDGKGYQSGRYAYADLWFNLDKKSDGLLEIVTLRDAMEIQAGKKKPKNQPAQKKADPTKKEKWKKAYRFYRGDYLMDESKNIYKVLGFDATKGINYKILKSETKKIDSEKSFHKRATPLLKEKFRPIHVDILGQVKS